MRGLLVQCQHNESRAIDCLHVSERTHLHTVRLQREERLPPSIRVALRWKPAERLVVHVGEVHECEFAVWKVSLADQLHAQ